MTELIEVGVVLPTSTVPAGGGLINVRRAARHAEQVGLDGVWAGDRLITGFPLLESTVVLTAAAAVTDRLTIGYSVMLLALRPPVWAAKQIATLQYISGNRVLLGVGVGSVFTTDEWQAAGIPSRGRARRTDLILTALPGLLGGLPTALSTEPDEPVVTLSPAVPMPPVWIGGTSDAALVRTVTHGCGWLAAMRTPDDLAHHATRLTALAGQRGVPRPRIGTMIFAWLTERDSTTAAAPVASYLAGAFGLDHARAESVAIGGSAEQVAEQLAAYLAVGASNLVIVPFGPDVFTQYDLIAQVRSHLLGA